MGRAALALWWALWAIAGAALGLVIASLTDNDPWAAFAAMCLLILAVAALGLERHASR